MSDPTAQHSSFSSTDVEHDRLDKNKKYHLKVFAMLSVGTLLEYVDVFLYVHMAVIMDKVFFPAKYSHLWFFANLTVCSTFIFKPFGTLIIGRIGDIFGRRFTIYITTTATAVVCLITMLLPSYNTIGISAAYILTLCKVFQGITSTGELQGAKLYMAENITGAKKQCIFAALLSVCASIGSYLSTSIAALAIYASKFHPDAWRLAFLLGAVIGCIGSYARTCLRESVEYANAKKMFLKKDVSPSHPVINKPIDKKTYLYFFATRLLTAFMATFLPLLYFKDLMLGAGLSQADILHQNQWATLFNLFSGILTILLIIKINPFKITLLRNWIGTILIITFPFCLYYMPSNTYVMFIFQVLIMSIGISDFPASPIIFKMFPVFKRVTTVLFSVSVAQALASLLWLSLMQFLIKYFGPFAWIVVLFPLAVIALRGTYYFQDLYKSSCIKYN